MMICPNICIANGLVIYNKIEQDVAQLQFGAQCCDDHRRPRTNSFMIRSSKVFLGSTQEHESNISALISSLYTKRYSICNKLQLGVYNNSLHCRHVTHASCLTLLIDLLHARVMHPPRERKDRVY